MKYRRDIDGLRAVAVIPVVLFHLEIDVFSGGFVGVDVFFVISGYLITSLIAEEIKGERFSLISFYERRARRILPALFAVIFASSVAASYFISTPYFLGEFGQSVAAAALFSANTLFWQDAGYFAIESSLKPLLHTWSLAIEEQFYIVFPIALMLAARFGGGRWGVIVLAAGGVSFASSVWEVAYNPPAAFFLASSRAWELMLGALLALDLISIKGNKHFREFASIAGIALIFGAVFAYTEATPFPGAAALAPCLGAALLIHSGKSEPTLVNRLLGARALVFVGLVSYSLYLWHWPIIVFTKIYLVRDLSGPEIAGVFVLSIIVAILSWRFIERPFRGRSARFSKPMLFSGAGIGAALLFAIGVVGPVTQTQWRPTLVNHNEGFVPIRVLYGTGSCLIRPEQKFEDWQSEACFINRDRKSNALLWGDSYAAHYVPGLKLHQVMLSQNILQYTGQGCVPVFGFTPHTSCAALNEHVLEVIENYNIETVILSARWEFAFEHGVNAGSFSRTIERLNALGLRVIVIGQTPAFASNAQLEFSARHREDRGPLVSYESLNKVMAEHSRGAEFIDPTPFLCDGTDCRYREDGELYFLDSGHLSAQGSDFIVKNFLSLLNGEP